MLTQSEKFQSKTGLEPAVARARARARDVMTVLQGLREGRG